jgi:LmbE family N-acetylglucosaminyl deacetylase
MARHFASAVALFAHPDDAEFMCGGTIAGWCASGTEVHYVVITDGSAGSNEAGRSREEISEVRLREQRAACDVLGVASVTFLGEVDGTLEVNLDTRRKVCREIRRLRPEVVVAPDPSRLWYGNGYINHWDHKQAGLLALTVVMPDAPTRPMFPELLDEGLQPFEVENLWLVTDDADTFVDISDSMDTKLAALAAHASQGAGEAWDRVRDRAEELAREANLDYRYAEAFKTFRFVDDHEEEPA